MNEEVKYYECQCYNELLRVCYQEDDIPNENEKPVKYISYELAIFEMPTSKMSWLVKLEIIWKLIKTGRIYHDQIILDSKQAEELSKFLNTHITPEKINE